jgi:CheY-like chemotaxis protein
MNVWVKVIGFSTEERHAIHTMLRLSGESGVRFRAWQPGDHLAPNVVLIDADSHEAELEVHSPTFNPKTKSLVVGGAMAIDGAWRTFERPLDWSQVLRALELLFVVAQTDRAQQSNRDHESAIALIPPGYKTALIIGLEREEQLYLKARLSLQGIAHVVEAANVGQASELLGRQGFEIVLLSTRLADADSASLIQALREHVQPPQAIIAVLDKASWESQQILEAQGVFGVLERPFIPHQVGEVFSRL